MPDGAPAGGERALFVTQREFGRQLDRIAELAEVVSLHELDAPSGGRPRVAITFDDAYRGAVVAGVRELVDRGLPGTLFVAPGRLDNHVFWWDALARPDGTLDHAVRDHALRVLAGSSERVREWAATAGVPAMEGVPRHAQSATVRELKEAAAYPGISVGSHTWSHPNLASLTEREIMAELEPARDWLQREFGSKSIAWLAYPYGLDSADARRVAARMGYVGALRVAGGWHHAANVPPLARPRLNIPAGVSLAGLSARMNGMVRS